MARAIVTAIFAAAAASTIIGFAAGAAALAIPALVIVFFTGAGLTGASTT